MDNRIKAVLYGPYVGSFEQELLTFHPHVAWIEAALKPTYSYIATHHNRLFMYDFINEANKFHVDAPLTQKESGQIGVSHQEFNKKRHMEIIRDVKSNISRSIGVDKKDIFVYSLGYSTHIGANGFVPQCQKRVRSLPIPQDVKRTKKKDFVLYIPNDNIPEENSYLLYTMLKKNFPIIVAGDKKTHLQSENFLSSKPDYLQNCYKHMVSLINQSDMVICPASHWTHLSSIQKAPVFSWGKDVSIYKTYPYVNTLALDDDNILRIYDQFAWSYERLLNNR